mgnify:CR=1 FL=1
MKIYKGFCASPGLVLGQVSRLEHHVETTTVGPFKPSRELQLLTDAIRTAQDELESMADRAAPSEQAIFQFQSMMLDDEGMMNEVRFCINAGVGAAAAMNQVGQRYADQLANMKDNPYMQLRSVDILDATRRVINIITNRPRMWLALDHFILRAFQRGADGVIMCGCHPGDCHYTTGNYYARRRMTLLFSMLDYLGIEKGRTRVEWVSAAEGQKFAETMNSFVETIISLGENKRLEDLRCKTK